MLKGPLNPNITFLGEKLWLVASQQINVFHWYYIDIHPVVYMYKNEEKTNQWISKLN